MLKKYLGALICFIFLGLNPLHAQEDFSNYKNYELTKTKFKLEKSNGWSQSSLGVNIY